MRLRGDSRPVSRVSEGILGTVMLVLGWCPWQSFSRIHLAAGHFRCPQFPVSRLRPEP